MKFLKTKAVLFAIFLIGVIFFSNDTGLIDIERTAIITAVAIDYDKEKSEYEVTAQIAVPEATDTNTENSKTQISTKGKTMASAIKHIGSMTGWFPQLYFCNLIILGNELGSENIIKTVDYFAKSLRVQDSANVVFAEKKAKDLIGISSPLDSMSSFAIQKVILKQESFDKDVMIINIKDFTEDYYSVSKSSYMPLIKKVEQESETSTDSQGQESGGGQEQKQDKTYLFDSRETALFYEGVMVGKLEKNLTFTFNLIHENCIGSEIVLENVEIDNENRNVLTTIRKHSHKKSLKVDDDKIILDINLKLKLQINDQTASKSDSLDSKNIPVPQSVKEKAKEIITENVIKLFEKEKESNCDFLGIKENLYRYHTRYYEKYKNNFLDKTQIILNLEIN